MKRNRIILITFFVIIIFIILGVFINRNNSKNSNSGETDYTPQEEISESQMRNTIVSLYFLDLKTNNIKPEGRQIDSIELLQNPYLTLIKLLIDGPKNTDLKSIIPENTQILEAYIKNCDVTLNFSSEILNFSDETQKFNIINSILKTLSELNEVESFNILINGEKNEQFPDTYSIIH